MEARYVMKNIIFGILSIIFFVIYYKVILIEIWTLWVPSNSTTNGIGILILITVIIPLSIISADQTIKIIKKSE